jgi:hypothetical protein
MNKEELRSAFREALQSIIDKSESEDGLSTWGDAIFFDDYKIFFIDLSHDDSVWSSDYLRIEVSPKDNPSGKLISTKKSWYGYGWYPFNEDMVNEIVEYVVDVIMQDKARSNESTELPL